MHNGIKCVACILKALVGKESSPALTQSGVDGAKMAVTVYNGEAVCVEHLHERIVYINLPVGRS